MFKKKHLFIYLLLFFPIFLQAQVYRGVKIPKSVDLGFFGGVSYYLGDINQSKHFYSTNQTIGILARYNINKRYSVRGSVYRTTLTGQDKDFSNIYQATRNHSFQNTITDLALQLEFNFFEYSTLNDGNNISPYVSLGIGTFFIENEGKMSPQINIPFSLGCKIRVNNVISFGAEWSMRKTSVDNIDGLDKQYFESENQNNPLNEKQKNYINSNDWYSFAGVFITVSLYEKKGRCRAYKH